MIAQLLLDCLHQDPSLVPRERLAALAADDWRALFAQAAATRVRPLLGYRLRSRGLAAEIPAAIQSACRESDHRAIARTLHVRTTLTAALSALRDRGIAVIVLKGAYLAGAVYRELVMRQMVDIDLLVQPGDLPDAVRALGAAGFGQRETWDERTDLATTYPYHLPPFTRQGGPPLELHWRLSPPSGAVDPGEVWERAVHARVAGIDALGLCPEDLLLHLAAHAAYHHQFELGLRPLCDIAETVRHHQAALDWPAFALRAKRWGWQRGVYLSLRLATDTLGAAVPQEALCQLRPDAFPEALVADARLVALQDGKTNRSMPPAMVTLSSVATLGARIRHVLRRVFAPAAVVAERYRVPARSARVLLYYPVRLKDLLQRHRRVAMQVWRNDPHLSAVARRKAAVRAWLSSDTKPSSS